MTADLMAQQYNAAFFTNSAEPRGHYEAEGIVTDAQYRAFQKLIEARHRGYKKAHRPMIFQNMKWVSTQLLAEGCRVPRHAEVLARGDHRHLWRRPVVVGSEHNPQANAEIQWRDFLDCDDAAEDGEADRPAQHGADALFGDGLAIEWDFSKVGPLQENFSNKVTDAVKLNRMGYPINMINRRLNLGFEDVPWGDTWFVSPLLVPVESMMDLNGNGNGNGNSKAHLASSRELQVPSVVTLLPALGGTSVEGRKRAALCGVRDPPDQARPRRNAAHRFLPRPGTARSSESPERRSRPGRRPRTGLRASIWQACSTSRKRPRRCSR